MQDNRRSARLRRHDEESDERGMAFFEPEQDGDWHEASAASAYRGLPGPDDDPGRPDAGDGWRESRHQEARHDRDVAGPQRRPRSRVSRASADSQQDDAQGPYRRDDAYQRDEAYEAAYPEPYGDDDPGGWEGPDNWDGPDDGGVPAEPDERTQVLSGEVVSSTIGPDPRVAPRGPESEPWADLDPDKVRRHRAPRELRLLVEFRVMGVVLRRELTKYWRSKSRIASGFAQPLLFLVIFGFGMQSVVSQASGFNFGAFVFPGVVAMSALGRALASAISIVYDGQHGFMREMLVAPSSRASIVIGALAGGAVTSAVQALLLLVAAPLMGLWPSPLALIESIFVVMLMAAVVTALGVAGATFIKSSQSFQAVTQTVMYPMLALSGALFPMQGLPGWIQVIGELNPFTYPVDALRRVLLEIHTTPDSPVAQLTGIELFGHSLSVLEELGITAAVTALMVAIAARNFARVE
ncbi:MAG: ABC transporter permease [Micromonosporaceae bacterium]